jgi:hypothetical protein
MKKSVIIWASVTILIGLLLIALLFLFADNTEVKRLSKRAEADFYTNVLTSFPSASHYKYSGYLSTDTRITGHIFEFEIKDSSNIYRVYITYKWVPEVEEWGFAGWKSDIKSTP